ncbi:Na+/H+ antiporter NhaC [Paraliobacillus salinarum]|uniref:Na+/H+ antiporter NhaC n=1 Tax=Paraliobacillus salinarum TaxID=1158996 RepID=UPI001C7143D3|nr:Na+/H+ antiporter NhaC [Paraliobacillus salinarum]
MMKQKRSFKFVHAVIPIVALIFIIVFGLIIQPRFFTPDFSMPLELIFILATIVSVSVLFYLGYSWDEMQKTMVQKISEGIPSIFILFSIGMLIGSWVIAGTIPMMIFYGIKLIIPSVIYLVGFIVPAIFSIVTGTSWGSVGTIGIVIFGIGELIGAHPAILAGAIVAGAYFGDKMSPLSDTTNVAAMATGVNLYEHIKSMLYTTGPSALIAGSLYFVLGFIFPPTITEIGTNSQIATTLTTLTNIYTFNPLLLLPPAIVLYGALKKKPTAPVIIISSLVGALLALIFQKFSLESVITTLINGFNTDMITWESNLPENLVTLLTRGGLYQLISAITICIAAFIFIGSMSVTNSLEIVVTRVTKGLRTKSQTIIAALFSTSITNALTSNQFATSFITAGAYEKKFKQMKISPKVLSRTLEDGGTMVENVIPWTTTGVFMAGTLGIPVLTYAPWQLLVWINYIVAITLAITGKGCFEKEMRLKDNNINSEKVS